MQSNVKGSVAAVSDRADNDYFNIALDDAELDDNWYIGDGSITDYVDGLRQGQQVVLEFNNESVNEIRKVNGDASEGVDDGSGAESFGEQGLVILSKAFLSRNGLSIRQRSRRLWIKWIEDLVRPRRITVRWSRSLRWFMVRFWMR